MKQKIVMKLTMQNEKMKSKAMQIAVVERGVASVTIEKENDKMVVIGEDIDVACLVKSLRRKFCFVEIVTVEEVKPPPPPPPPKPSSPKHPPCPPPPYYYPYECPVYDPNPPTCSIM